MTGTRMPETCWAVFKRRAINLRDWCIWLVDLFECMMMHGLTNPKHLIRFSFLPHKLNFTPILIWFCYIAQIISCVKMPASFFFLKKKKKNSFQYFFLFKHTQRASLLCGGGDLKLCSPLGQIIWPPVYSLFRFRK
jgi:hypothetical protein